LVSVQLLGIATAFVWTFPTVFIMFKLIDKTIGLRVSPEEELEGLDITEHGGIAYPDFGLTAYAGGSPQVKENQMAGNKSTMTVSLEQS
jgi:Amt family ammonium transporter